MSNYIGLLVTVLYNNELLKCALSVNMNKVSAEIWMWPDKEENKVAIRKLLPEHVRSCGPVVEVEEIFEVAEAEYEEGER